MNSRFNQLQLMIRAYNDVIKEHIEYYTKSIQQEEDEKTIFLMEKMLRVEKYNLILNNGILNNIQNKQFYSSCLTNIKISNLELLEFVENGTRKYDLEENIYLTLCKTIKDEVNAKEVFCKLVEEYFN